MMFVSYMHWQYTMRYFSVTEGRTNKGILGVGLYCELTTRATPTDHHFHDDADDEDEDDDDDDEEEDGDDEDGEDDDEDEE